jgi:predicted metal-dependent phosphoesterase TrpH
VIDLHVHSTASDGTFAPAELAEKGRDFSVMALTDHDNMDGVDEFLSASASSSGLRLPGIELSVDPGEGYGHFHMLGLGIDTSYEPFKAFLRRILDGRNERNERMIANFARIGIEIPPDEIAGYAHGEVLARPHFAAWLVDHGFAADKMVAFKTYLTPGSPPETRCYASRYRPDPGEAIDLIHAAHGVAIMAHPRFWTTDPAMLRSSLRRLKDRGLDGIEAVYQANEPEETIAHLRAAKEIGLCVTAGSDFHGAHKPTITLGMSVDDERTFIAPFLERLDFWRNAATA